MWIKNCIIWENSKKFKQTPVFNQLGSKFSIDSREPFEEDEEGEEDREDLFGENEF